MFIIYLQPPFISGGTDSCVAVVQIKSKSFQRQDKL